MSSFIKLMINPPLVKGCFYHIYNRGVEKRNIYLGKRDYLRFLETVNYYRKNPLPMKFSDFKRNAIRLKNIDNQKELIKLYGFSLMPNHFHLLLQQLEDNGITIFMRKLADSYTKYFNTKYDRVGPLFQGSFKAKIIENDEYLLHVSKYIHRNSFPLKMWEAKVYPYSSYNYYLSGESHPFCDTDFILGYFSKTNPKMSYQSFVEAEMLDDPALFNLLIDHDNN